jgi:hypothetical protein
MTYEMLILLQFYHQWSTHLWKSSQPRQMDWIFRIPLFVTSMHLCTFRFDYVQQYHLLFRTEQQSLFVCRRTFISWKWLRSLRIRRSNTYWDWMWLICLFDWILLLVRVRTRLAGTTCTYRVPHKFASFSGRNFCQIIRKTKKFSQDWPGLSPNLDFAQI